MQAIVNSSNNKFHDLFVFNTLKLFSPKYCASDEEVHKTMVGEIDHRIWIDDD